MTQKVFVVESDSYLRVLVDCLKDTVGVGRSYGVIAQYSVFARLLLNLSQFQHGHLPSPCQCVKKNSLQKQFFQVVTVDWAQCST